jgi:hypothetical protein
MLGYVWPGGNRVTLCSLQQEIEMTVYIVNYRGTVYGVFDSRDKAVNSEYGDLYDTVIIEMTVL